MKHYFRTFVAGMALGLAALSSGAYAASVTAGGEGWCNSGFGCNATSGINNTFAGRIGGSAYRDWFSFAIPVVGVVTNAKINIWNDLNDFTSDPAAVYNLYQASAINFGGLLSGSVLGSVSVSAADTGVSHFESIVLNAAGVAALNAAQGSTFVFGGDVATGFSTNVQIFGYTGGVPIATLDISVTAVPEPETYAMLLAGLGLLGFAAKRRKQVAA